MRKNINNIKKKLIKDMDEEVPNAMELLDFIKENETDFRLNKIHSERIKFLVNQVALSTLGK